MKIARWFNVGARRGGRVKGLGAICLSAWVCASTVLAEEPGVLPGASALALTPPGASSLVGRSGQAGPSQSEVRRLFWQAVQAAADRSPQLRRLQAEHQAASSDVTEARGQRLPQLDLGTRSRPLKWGAGSEFSDASSQGLDIQLVTPVYDWGRIAHTLSSRQLLAQAAAAAIEVELEDSAYAVTTTLLELGKQRVIIELAEQFEARMSELVDRLARIAAADPGRSSELVQARARLLQAQSARENAESQAATAQIQLHRLVGERPMAIPRTRDWNIPPADLAILLAQVDGHPGIQRSEAGAEAARLQASIVRASALPRLDWVINKNTGKDALGRDQPWQTALTLNWSAFRGGSLRAAERAQLQRAEAGREQTEQLREELRLHIGSAHQLAQASLQRAELYQALVGETDAIRLAFHQQWYHLGKRSLLDVLGAESDHFANQVNEITSRFEGYQAIMRQYSAAGALIQWLRDGR